MNVLYEQGVAFWFCQGYIYPLSGIANAARNKAKFAISHLQEKICQQGIK